MLASRNACRVSVVNAEDVLLWPDGFWCFRDEFSPRFLRAEDYRVIPHGSEEWARLTKEP
jgi:hypothetical protein